MGLRFRWRNTFSLGPLRFANGRYTGWGLRCGWWGWNARTGRHSIDSPGPGSWHYGRRRSK